jgi:hypothetical protein
MRVICFFLDAEHHEEEVRRLEPDRIGGLRHHAASFQ